MFRILVAALIAVACNPTSARDRPTSSCDQAPLLSDMQKNLPGYVLSSKAEIKPKLLTKISRTTIPAGEILKRTRQFSLICIVLAVDANGKVQDAAVSYPRVSLTEKEREKFLLLEYLPAQNGGQAVPSLVNIDITTK